MKVFFARHPILRRVCVTLGLIAVYMLGRYIPIPNVILGDYIKLSPFLAASVSLSGANLSQIGLFSLGIGPMMYSMLLSQLFNLGQGRQVQFPKLAAVRQNLLMFSIAMIQALGIAIGLHYPSDGIFLEYVLQASLVLTTGAIVLSWFSNLNSAYGIGGPSVIMLISIIANQFQNIPTIVELFQNERYGILLGFLIWGLITIFMMVFLDKAEYRIPLQRMSIHNRYATQSYIPIKVNIAGGMPLMYAYSFLAFPSSVAMLVTYFFPSWQWITEVASYFTTTQFYGVLLYMLIILFLTLMMSFVAVDVVSLAEGLRSSGDYIPGIRPGRLTKDYLSYFVRRFAWINGLYLMLLAGLPLLVTLGDPKAQQLAGLMGILMMISGILISVLEEVKVMRLKKNYVSLFD